MLPSRIVTLPRKTGNAAAQPPRRWYHRAANLTEDAGMLTRPTKLAQRGMGTFCTLLVIAIAAVAAYYVYMGVTGEGEAPTCGTEFEYCMKQCRRTAADNDAAQACQKKCEKDADLCRMAARRNQQK